MRDLPRLLSKVVEGDEDVLSVILEGIKGVKYAPSVGITGPPGAGKSSLIGELAVFLNRAGKKVGILAVDPVSPFSGGSLLGDRIRMKRCESLDGVYVRSVSGNGERGLPEGLSEMELLFSMFGYDVVLVETPGSGQADVSIRDYVDLLILVVPPGSGDDIQFLKSGVLEVVDAFVLSKFDLSEAKETLDILKKRQLLAGEKKPIFPVSSKTGEGIDRLSQFITDFIEEPHKDALERKIVLAVRDRVYNSIIKRLKAMDVEDIIHSSIDKGDVSTVIKEVEKRWLEKAFL